MDLLRQRCDQWRRLCYICRAESVANLPLDIAHYWLGMLATSFSVIITDLCERASVSRRLRVLFFYKKATFLQETFLFLVTTLSCKRGCRNKDALACPHTKRFWGSANYLFIMSMKVVSHLEESS